jgi:dihydrofolate reductase
MRLTVHEFVTLDGVVQGPGAPDEDPRDGFEHGGWVVPYSDADFGEIVDGWFAKTAVVLLGRSTYDMMHPYWMQVTDPDNLVAAKLNGLPKHVVSNTLTDPVWPNSTVISDNVVAAVRELKGSSAEGELQVHGSCALVHTLQEAGLIDEYRLIIFPVTVGAGKRLFSDAAPPAGYTLVSSRTTGAGAIYAELTPTPFTAGTFGVDEGHEVST